MARAHRQGVDRRDGSPTGAPGGELSPETRVGDLLARRPQAAMVFVRRRMACAGCELNAFDTLAGAARCYGVDVAELLAELNA